MRDADGNQFVHAGSGAASLLHGTVGNLNEAI